MADPATASLALTVGSTLFSAVGAIRAGNDAKSAADYEAAQQERMAGQERAAGQRRMIEEMRQMRLTTSRARAVNAASGGGALDPSVIDIMGDLESEGQYRADTAMYESEERARNLQGGANISRFQGKQARTAGYIKGISTLASGASTLYSRFGDANPSSSDTGGAYGGGYTDTSSGRIDWYPTRR